MAAAQVPPLRLLVAIGCLLGSLAGCNTLSDRPELSPDKFARRALSANGILPPRSRARRVFRKVRWRLRFHNRWKPKRDSPMTSPA